MLGTLASPNFPIPEPARWARLWYNEPLNSTNVCDPGPYVSAERFAVGGELVIGLLDISLVPPGPRAHGPLFLFFFLLPSFGTAIPPETCRHNLPSTPDYMSVRHATLCVAED